MTEESPDADDERSDQSDEEAPLADLARSMEEEPEEAPGEDLFEEMEVGGLEAEAVWETVAESETEGAGPGSGGPGGAVEEVEPEGPAPDGEHVVDKREFCHRCTHFTEPPETACAHEGTEIVEVVDSDHFRVRNCPMVGEDDRPDFNQD